MNAADALPVVAVDPEVGSDVLADCLGVEGRKQGRSKYGAKRGKSA